MPANTAQRLKGWLFGATLFFAEAIFLLILPLITSSLTPFVLGTEVLPLSLTYWFLLSVYLVLRVLYHLR